MFVSVKYSISVSVLTLGKAKSVGISLTVQKEVSMITATVRLKSVAIINYYSNSKDESCNDDKLLQQQLG